MIKDLIKSNNGIKKICCKIYNLLNNNVKYFHIKGVKFFIGETTLIHKMKVSSSDNNNRIIIGNNCRLNHVSFKLSGNGNIIEIGNDVSLNNIDFHTENNENVIKIGNNTTVHGKTEISAIEGSKVLVGEDCMFSRDIYISTGDGHSIINDKGIRTNSSKDIYIKNHVWIGTQTIIHKGTIIGNNSIVGAGSICISKYSGEDNVIYAGNPAQIIKRNIDWKRERVQGET